jgi:hypothetical protein
LGTLFGAERGTGAHPAGGAIPVERREVKILRDKRGVGHEKESQQR